jgi:ribosome biogenesis GTPase A
MLWYPGHMAGAKAIVRENLKLIDLVIEVLDARIPESSRNPELIAMTGGKPRLLILNKADLADPMANEEWEKWFHSQRETVVAFDALSGRGIRKIVNLVQQLVEPTMSRLKRRGRKPRAARLMVIGVPNVGKSSLINRLAEKRRTAIGAKPGITRGKQWVRVEGSHNLELLDTPGILWPRTDGENTAMYLAVTGAIPQEAFSLDEVALWLCTYLLKNAPEGLRKRYRIDKLSAGPHVVLADIGEQRGFLLPGGLVDVGRASEMLLREFQEGKLGCHTLELPEEGDPGNV